MASIEKKSFDSPDQTLDFVHGKSVIVRIGEEECWRSELEPGWSFDEDLKPYAEGNKTCPLTHREYVVSGRIRYLTEDGIEMIGEPGDFLFIQPGHRAWVEGDETCVLIDW
ncbi:MAG: hypothetical protein ACRDIU_00935 [Actinomycetota bacterium]